MIHRIAGPAYRKMREYAQLTPKEVADALGTKRQSISRLENGQRKLLLRRSEEDALIEVTELTPTVFGQIMCETLTPFVERSVIMLSSDQTIPSLIVMRALKLFQRYSYKLTPSQAEHVEELLREARSAHAATERFSSLLAKAAIHTINEARRAKGDVVPSEEEA